MRWKDHMIYEHHRSTLKGNLIHCLCKGLSAFEQRCLNSHLFSFSGDFAAPSGVDGAQDGVDVQAGADNQLDQVSGGALRGLLRGL